MQSVEISGLREIITKLDVAPELIREARAEFFAEAGASLLSDVQGRIGGTGKIARVQEYRVGSGKGYVAVRAKAKTNVGKYAAGYITNALENSHAVRTSSGSAKRKRKSRAKMRRVPGKYMYHDTAAHEMQHMAEAAAQRIEDAAMKALEGGTE